MLLASAIAGIGFGNAGVHLPHGMSYPVAGMVKNFKPDGYQVDHPLIPHGMSVIFNTAAVVRFTASVNPQRHLRAAQALGADIRHVDPKDAGNVLADKVIWFMRRLGIPNGLIAVGYTEHDIPDLVAGTLPQHRVTKLSPRPRRRSGLDRTVSTIDVHLVSACRTGGSRSILSFTHRLQFADLHSVSRRILLISTNYFLGQKPRC